MKFLYINSLKNASQASSGLFYENFESVSPELLDLGPFKLQSFSGDCGNICNSTKKGTPKLVIKDNGNGINSCGTNSSISSASELAVTCFPVDYKTRTSWSKIRFGFHVSLDAVTHTTNIQYGFGMLDILGELSSFLNITEFNFQGFYQETNSPQTSGLVINNINTENAICRTSGYPFGGLNLLVKRNSLDRSFTQNAASNIYCFGQAGYSATHVYLEIDRSTGTPVWKVFIGNSSSARPKSEQQFKERLQVAFGGLSGNFADESGGPIPGHIYYTLTVPSSNVNFMSHFGMISNRSDLRIDAVGYYVLDELPTKIDITTGEPQPSVPVPDGDGSAPTLDTNSVYFRFRGVPRIYSQERAVSISYRNVGETNFSIMPCDVYVDDQQRYLNLSSSLEVDQTPNYLFKSNLSGVEISNIEELKINGVSCYEIHITGFSSLKTITGVTSDGCVVSLGDITSLENISLVIKDFEALYSNESYLGISIDVSGQSSLKYLKIHSSEGIDYDLSLMTSFEYIQIEGGRSLITPNSPSLTHVKFTSKSGTSVNLSASTSVETIIVEGEFTGALTIADSASTVNIWLTGNFGSISATPDNLTGVKSFIAKGNLGVPFDASGFTSAETFSVGDSGGVNNFGIPSANSNLKNLSISGTGSLPAWADYPNLGSLSLYGTDNESLDLSTCTANSIIIEGYESSLTLPSSVKELESKNTGNVLTGGLSSLDLSATTNLTKLKLEGHNLSSITLGTISDEASIQIIRSTDQISIITGIVSAINTQKIWNGFLRYELKDGSGANDYRADIPFGSFFELCAGRFWTIRSGYWDAQPPFNQLPWPYNLSYDFSTKSYDAVNDLYIYDSIP